MAIHVISKSQLAELKSTPGSVENVVITLGQNSKGDSKGALYYWDSLSTEAEDTVYYNTVIATGTTTGRWKKVFTRMQNLPHGILVSNAGKKEFFANNKSISATSDITVYLTMDGTATGTPIFSEVWFDDSKAVVNTASVNDAVASYRISLSSDLKTLKHGFYRGNSNAVSVLGVNLLSFRGAVAGTLVNFKIEGI